MIKKLFVIAFCLTVIITTGVETNTLGGLFRSSTAYAVGDLIVDWGGGILESQPIFTIANMFPGQSVLHTVKVKNNSSTFKPIGIRGDQRTPKNGLENYLMITISEGLNNLYGPKSLAQFYRESMTGISLSNLSSGATADYKFKVLFDQSAGNNMQNKNLSIDLHIGIDVATPLECQSITFSGLPIFGTDKPDILNGTAGNDLIFGFDGVDMIDGKGGNDCIVGGAGADFIRGGNGNDVILGGEGPDYLDGGSGNDNLIGGFGNDYSFGGTGTDLCISETKISCEL